MKYVLSWLMAMVPFLSYAQSTDSARPRHPMIPDIGVNVLMLGQDSNRNGAANGINRNGFDLNEVELQMIADVDPSWRLVSLLSIHQEVTQSSDTPPARQAEWKIEPEEVFAESLDLPSLTAKVGKFKAEFGKHNLLHTHAYPMVNAPLPHATLLGDEGFNDTGLSLAYLIPLSWYSEIVVQALNGKGEAMPAFDSPLASHHVGVAHLKNLWDLSDVLTMELGLSGASGFNKDQMNTTLTGGDLTFKWRPGEGADHRALVWSTESLFRRQTRSTYEETGKGWSSTLQYRFLPRWWLGLRADALEMADQDPSATDPLPEKQSRESLLIAYVPTEFSAVRLQIEQLDDRGEEREKKALLQFNYSIGAHPAHNY